MNMLRLIKDALYQYGLDPGHLVIEKELQIHNWHGDIHYKIDVNGEKYSARFIESKRYEHGAFIELTDDVLKEQIKFTRFLVHSGIPFMKHCSTLDGKEYGVIRNEEKEWKIVLFQWMEGKHLTECTEEISERFGQMSRKIHDISSDFTSSILPKTSHLVGYKQFYTMLSEQTDGLIPGLRDYLQLAANHLKKAESHSLEFIVQSDLNNLNILWNDRNEVMGIVDFESITYTDRVEGLAWLIKWYSRTQGLDWNEKSVHLARAFLQGYGISDFTNSIEITRLTSLIWLSGCLNWNFTAKTLELMKSKDPKLTDHLASYFRRGDALVRLVEI